MGLWDRNVKSTERRIDAVKKYLTEPDDSILGGRSLLGVTGNLAGFAWDMAMNPIIEAMPTEVKQEILDSVNSLTETELGQQAVQIIKDNPEIAEDLLNASNFFGLKGLVGLTKVIRVPGSKMSSAKIKEAKGILGKAKATIGFVGDNFENETVKALGKGVTNVAANTNTIVTGGALGAGWDLARTPLRKLQKKNLTKDAYASEKEALKAGKTPEEAAEKLASGLVKSADVRQRSVGDILKGKNKMVGDGYPYYGGGLFMKGVSSLGELGTAIPRTIAEGFNAKDITNRGLFGMSRGDINETKLLANPADNIDVVNMSLLREKAAGKTDTFKGLSAETPLGKKLKIADNLELYNDGAKIKEIVFKDIPSEEATIFLQRMRNSSDFGEAGRPLLTVKRSGNMAQEGNGLGAVAPSLFKGLSNGNFINYYKKILNKHVDPKMTELPDKYLVEIAQVAAGLAPDAVRELSKDYTKAVTFFNKGKDFRGKMDIDEEVIGAELEYVINNLYSGVKDSLKGKAKATKIPPSQLIQRILNVRLKDSLGKNLRAEEKILLDLHTNKNMLSSVSDDAGKAIGNKDLSKLKSPEGRIWGRTYNLSSEKDLGGLPWIYNLNPATGKATTVPLDAANLHGIGQMGGSTASRVTGTTSPAQFIDFKAGRADASRSFKLKPSELEKSVKQLEKVTGIKRKTRAKKQAKGKRGPKPQIVEEKPLEYHWRAIHEGVPASREAKKIVRDRVSNLSKGTGVGLFQAVGDR